MTWMFQLANARRYEYAVKTALSHHPTVQEKVVVIDRGSLKQGSLNMLNSGRYFEALLIHLWTLSRTFLGVCTHPYTGARVSSTYARTHVPTSRRFVSKPSAAFYVYLFLLLFLCLFFCMYLLNSGKRHVTHAYDLCNDKSRRPGGSGGLVWCFSRNLAQWSLL